MYSKMEVERLVARIEKNIKPPRRSFSKKWAKVFDIMENGDSIVVNERERAQVWAWRSRTKYPPMIKSRNIDKNLYRVWLVSEWKESMTAEQVYDLIKEGSNDTRV